MSKERVEKAMELKPSLQILKRVIELHLIQPQKNPESKRMHEASGKTKNITFQWQNQDETTLQHEWQEWKNNRIEEKCSLTFNRK